MLCERIGVVCREYQGISLANLTNQSSHPSAATVRSVPLQSKWNYANCPTTLHLLIECLVILVDRYFVFLAGR